MNELQELRHKVDGMPHRPGLMERMQTLEEWRVQRDAERRQNKALVVGVVLGLMGNTIGIAAVLRILLTGGF